jgi:F-box and WD-40 domain protein CDC4
MQKVLADAGHCVTSLAIDNERIVVGMVKSKINVFSALTVLYAHTLLGHDAGVWCLTLISRSGKGAKRAAADNILTTDYGKDKMTVNSPEDGSGGKPHQAAANVVLLRVH